MKANMFRHKKNAHFKAFFELDGANYRNRTRNLLITNQLNSQLIFSTISYYDEKRYKITTFHIYISNFSIKTLDKTMKLYN